MLADHAALGQHEFFGLPTAFWFFALSECFSQTGGSDGPAWPFSARAKTSAPASGHFFLLRFTNRNSSRFQRLKPSICVSNNAPCMLVRIARIFAVPRAPTTRTVSPGLRVAF